MHQNSYDLFKRHALPLFKPNMNVLEVGPDWEDVDQHLSLRQLVQDAGCVYFGCNVENNRNSVVRMRDPYRIDCNDDLFDVVFSANVVEHVPKLWTWFEELARIARAGGLVIAVSPVNWPYHPGGSVDCWRLYPDAYRALFEEAGLDEVLCLTGGTDVIDTVAVGRKR